MKNLFKDEDPTIFIVDLRDISSISLLNKVPHQIDLEMTLGQLFSVVIIFKIGKEIVLNMSLKTWEDLYSSWYSFDMLTHMRDIS